MSQSLPVSANHPPATDAIQSEPRYAYHRLMRRDPNYRWWRPLAVGSTSLGFFLILTIGVVVAMLVVVLLNPTLWEDPDSMSSFEDVENINMADPTEFIITMLSLIIIIPACFFGYLLLGPKPVGLLLSVTGKLRMKWLGISTLAALILYTLYFGGLVLLEQTGVIAATEVPAESIPASPLLMILLVLLLVPFQAAAEEYLFRGMLMQIIGSWLKHPLFAILLPVPLFVIGHLYDLYGQVDVAVFAIAAGYLTWRTGGLEAAIGLHTVNNVVLFIFGSVGLMDLNAEGSSLSSLISSVVLTGVTTLILLQLAKRFKIERTAGPAPLPPQPHYLVPWPAPQQLTQPPYGYYPPAQQQTPSAPHPTGAYWNPPPGYQQPTGPTQPPADPTTETDTDRDSDPHRPTQG